MTGVPSFVSGARDLLWGPVLPEIGDRIATVQCAAGTNGLSLVGQFTKRLLNIQTALISDPNWPNYQFVFGDAGHRNSYYPYLTKEMRLNLPSIIETLEKSPEGSLVILQACAHNPSGVDPKPEQWREIFDAVERKRHTICFDFAYMGFASGSMDKDASIIREYARTGHQFFVSFSFSKCMGMYGERIGACHAVCATPAEARAVEGHLASCLRSSISLAPQNGALIAAEILNSPALRSQWQGELKSVCKRIIDIRSKFCDHLEDFTNDDWGFLRDQKGMFALTKFSPAQCEDLASKGVFIPLNGRISIPSLNRSNVEAIAKRVAMVARGK